ncbi:topoisomerase DNA-binding C4 zinc finger domain-containing protein, partial [Candidatus Woesearchaeota archaeon]|nr:topoisomerase DNA-binding C4 zinc finger domain-containing protein [Candidatus Woesearchaeota archaeon]
YKRGYVTGKQIKPTPLGIEIISILEERVPKIIDEELTRNFEEAMEGIREGRVSEEEVISKAKRLLIEVLKEFKRSESKIGEGLKRAKQVADSNSWIGVCPVCGKGHLVVRYSKQRKRFLACDRYPECSASYPIPQAGKIYKTDKKCKECGSPIIRVYIPEFKRSKTICINPNCPSNMSVNEGNQCPKCHQGKLVVRTSKYGRFLACDRYPECKYTEKL